jgi:hypothetical protein
VNDKAVAFVVYPGLTLTNDDLAPAVRLGLEYDPHPLTAASTGPLSTATCSLPKSRGYAREALAEDPGMLGRLLGNTAASR